MKKTYVIAIFIFSFFVSTLLKVGMIDQDFFSYYYVGRGINQGKNMFMDFADNKGPVHYLFFAALYKLFGENYHLALIAANTLIDAIISILLYLFIKKMLPKDGEQKPPPDILLLATILLLVKSFSIGSILGGVYSEGLGMIFLLFSLLLWQKNSSFLSGVLFALSALTRQTFAFFALFFLINFLKEREKIKLYLKTLLGTALTTLLLASIVAYRGDFGYFIENTILYNIKYASGTSLLTKLSSFSHVSAIEFRILVSLTITSLGIIFLHSKEKETYHHRKLFFPLLIPSIAATLAGGIFYFHHFLHFLPTVILSLIILYHKGERFKFLASALNIALLVSSISSFFIYAHLGSVRKDNPLKLDVSFENAKINEISQKKYLQVVPYYPKIYFDYGKNSPDRYYQGFHISRYYNTHRTSDVQRHKNLSREKVKNTTFVFVSCSKFDTRMIDEYRKTFQEDFKLERESSYKIGQFKIDVYLTKT